MTKAKTEAATIRDVARLAGVSVATVSRYLNKNAPLSPDAETRVQQAMTELNYEPHAMARSLATLKTNAIGLMLNKIEGDFFTPLLEGIENEATQAGYHLLISSSASIGPGRSSPLGPRNTDGLLVFSNAVAEPALRRLSESHFPVVLIHQSPPPDLRIPCVTVENKAATFKIVSHLIEKHQRRHIVLLRGPDDQEDSHWRETGYRQALDVHGLPFDPRLVRPGNFEREMAYRSMKEILSEGLTVDGVFAGDDEAALGAILAIQEAGLKVPDDVAMVGFDDQRISEYINPPLTTVRAPTEQVGRTATQLLINLINTGEAQSLTLLPTELILRRSCGCST